VVAVSGASGSAGPAGAGGAYPTSAAVVARRSLTSQDEVDGTLGRAGSCTVVNQAPGTVTALPAVGHVVRAGQVLYQVNGSPVVLLYGTVPAWRAGRGRDRPGRDRAERRPGAAGLCQRSPAGPALGLGLFQRRDWLRAGAAAVPSGGERPGRAPLQQHTERPQATWHPRRDTQRAAPFGAVIQHTMADLMQVRDPVRHQVRAATHQLDPKWRIGALHTTPLPAATEPGRIPHRASQRRDQPSSLPTRQNYQGYAWTALTCPTQNAGTAVLALRSTASHKHDLCDLPAISGALWETDGATS
jgi:hypothetical protein